MSQQCSCKFIAVVTALFLGGCDVDEEQISEVGLVAEASGQEPATALPAILLNAPEELEIEEDNWSEFDLSDASQPVAAPQGKTCCVNCADGWSGWWNRGNGDQCNKRGAEWCHAHNWNFINAEWFNNCPAW